MSGTSDSDWRASWSQFRGWMLNEALPLWADKGVDRSNGGFFESVSRDGDPIQAPRRTRLVARQTFVFATAAQHIWLPGAADLAARGFETLFAKCTRPDGLVTTAYDVATGNQSKDLDLYDHAFALFAYAHAAALPSMRERAKAQAQRLLVALRTASQEPVTGVGDFKDTGHRLTNPYMHLFEAAIACARAFPKDLQWKALANNIERLRRNWALDGRPFAITELYGRDWRPTVEASENWIEPGHQYEWAWLLLEHSANENESIDVATRLIEFAELKGVTSDRLRALDALHTDGRLRDGGSKLWQQCERFRALARMAKTDRDTPRKESWLSQALMALEGLNKFLDPINAGLWYDACNANGRMIDAPVKASSLYHLVGAFLEGEALDRRLKA